MCASQTGGSAVNWLSLVSSQLCPLIIRPTEREWEKERERWRDGAVFICNGGQLPRCRLLKWPAGEHDSLGIEGIRWQVMDSDINHQGRSASLHETSVWTTLWGCARLNSFYFTVSIPACKYTVVWSQRKTTLELKCWVMTDCRSDDLISVIPCLPWSTDQSAALLTYFIQYQQRHWDLLGCSCSVPRLILTFYGNYIQRFFLNTVLCIIHTVHVQCCMQWSSH